jgi:uncharacterized membrane protein YheB (UPF0754 family)
MNVQEVVAALGAQWPVYVSMPFVAALIGYVTKRVAIEMMFRPLEFRGIRGLRLGWQGVLPANAERMAATATEILTSHLVAPGEIVGRLEPALLAKEISGPLLEVVEDVTREVMEQYQPRLWEALPDRARQRLLARVRAEAPHAVARILRGITDDIDEVLDLKHLVVTSLVQDKALLNRLIRDISRPELTFIARSGAVFGFTLGIVQLTVWSLTHSPIVLPLFGLGIGWFTDWLALKMIFLPREPRRFFGLCTWQGVFQKRRDRIAADYGDLIAREVITIPNLVEAVLRGPGADRLFQLVTREVQRTVDTQAAIAKPLVALAVGSRRYQALKRAAAIKAVERVPETIRRAGARANGALEVRETIVARMRRLSPVEFEGLLRPAFRQDEWKLIAVGAIIGGIVGELQVLLLLH